MDGYGRRVEVGPQSAGADPGPACYGRGEGATVTDANLVLGRFHPDHFLGGAMRLDAACAHRARPLSPAEASRVLEALAEGIVRVANARMESALRQVSVERGHNPRSFTLLAFGGAGRCTHVRWLLRSASGTCLFPPAPGALSALGILDADLRREFSRTVMLAPGSPQIRMSSRTGSRSARSLRDEGATRKPALAPPIFATRARVRTARRLDRQRGREFSSLHAQSYGYADPARPVEVVTLACRRSRALPSRA